MEKHKEAFGEALEAYQIFEDEHYYICHDGRELRHIRTEGHFGDNKENEDFRRFNYRTAEKVYKEFMLYAIGRNINKYHRFLQHEIERYEGKADEKTA